MPFKNPNQRKFLFEMDKQKNQGGGIPSNPGTIPVNKSPGNSFSTSRPPQMTQPPKAFSLGVSGSPKPFQPHTVPSMGSSIKPTAVPALPAAPKLPKFQKMKKFMKGPL